MLIMAALRDLMFKFDWKNEIFGRQGTWRVFFAAKSSPLRFDRNFPFLCFFSLVRRELPVAQTRSQSKLNLNLIKIV